MTKITFAEDAWEEYLYWQSRDKKTLRKINELLKDVQRQPFMGLGKPEPLKGLDSDKWSRRINDKDRLVYMLADDMVVVLQCKGHYEDK